MCDIQEPMDESEFQPCVDMKQLPHIMLGRVKALKNLQMETVKADIEYYREIQALDIKYQTLYNNIHQTRAQILSGAHEPSGPELEWPSDDEEDEEEGKVVSHPDFPADAVGLPKFWLHTLKNVNEDLLFGLIEPHDESVLENLIDITARLHEDKNGFTLLFSFQENPYFSNKVLTKDYTWRCDPDPAKPLIYEGPEIVGCKGCTIDWKEGMDVTKKKMKVKTIAKKKGKDDSSPVKVITKEAKVESFFNFFNPPTVKDGEEIESEMNDILNIDYEVGSAIKDKIIPRAVLYFTGEILDIEDSSDEEYEEEEEDEEDDEL